MLTLDSAQQLCAVYVQMARAAQDNDWDRLSELGLEAVHIREDAQHSLASPLTNDQAVELATTIRRIQTLEQDIRLHAEPAFDSVRKLLAVSVKDRTVRNAYGSV